MEMIADYDDTLTAIYEAGTGCHSISDMLRGMARLLDAAAAGFLIYDESGTRVTHSVAVPPRTVSVDWQRRWSDMNTDPGIQVLAGARFSEPRRFTDFVPAGRLRSAGWFRRQEVSTGLGYGIALDLDLTGLRVRLFGMRAASEPDFENEPLDMLGRLGRHVERAFSSAPSRLAPDKMGKETGLLIYRGADLAPILRSDHPVALQLVARFGLTAAEARVAVEAAKGRARCETAAILGVSLNSLKTHLKRIHVKMGIARAGELIRMVAAAGNSP